MPSSLSDAPVSTKALAVLQTCFGNRQTLLSTVRDLMTTTGTLTSLLSPFVSIEWPSDLTGATRDTLLHGEISAVISGNPVGMSVAPQDDVLTVAIQSPLLPRLPSSQTLVSQTETTIPFWDKRFSLQPQEFQFTNENVA